MRKPDPALGQRWRFCGREGIIVRICPGGGGDAGIAEFAGDIPAAHVSTMMRFDAWTFVDADLVPVVACGPVPIRQGEPVAVTSDGRAAFPEYAGRPLRALADALFGWMEAG